jgi:ubiquinone/menaquinone biosynthesis C-methylase UbiE
MPNPAMKIADPQQTTLQEEIPLLLQQLPVRGARIVELGCGKADKTRALASSGRVGEIVAFEVDTAQHALNLQIITDLPSVRFRHGGAQAIPEADASADIVMMFKSLHHVPVADMDRALDEIRRVLKPGGHAWISEPVFAGELNEIMRLFHNEQIVRAAAFAAMSRAVAAGRFALKRQFFFNTATRFKDFTEFDARMIRVTHSDHELSPDLYRQVQAAFAPHLTAEGARFLTPQRVDWLRKPERS